MTATQLHDIQQDRTSKNVLAPRLYLAMNVPFGHTPRAAASPASEKGVKQEYAYDSTQAERYAAISLAMRNPRLALGGCLLLVLIPRPVLKCPIEGSQADSSFGCQALTLGKITQKIEVQIIIIDIGYTQCIHRTIINDGVFFLIYCGENRRGHRGRHPAQPIRTENALLGSLARTARCNASAISESEFSAMSPRRRVDFQPTMASRLDRL